MILKILLTSIFIVTVILQGAGYKDYYELYENFNRDPVTALSKNTAAYLLDFMPVNMDELDADTKFLVSGSVFVRQQGSYYGRDVKNGENVDMLKSFCVLYNHRRDFMPFLSYHTPYKSVLNKREAAEYIKKRDALSFGILSDMEAHQIGMSFDALMSSYTVNQLDPVITESSYTRAGFSARMFLNKKMNRRSSMFLSIVSPVFFQFDIKGEKDEDRIYFDKLISSTGFNYKYNKFYASYSFVYRTFEKKYDVNNGRQLTYPWLAEHNIIFGYRPDKNIRFSIDYQLLPSIFTKNMPAVGDIYRHTVGFFAGVDLNNVSINFRYADSKMFSDPDLGRIYFQTDIIYIYK